jgi:KipI family sensor histidine kinase inhibitor
MTRVHPYGDRALLVEVADVGEVVALTDALAGTAECEALVEEVVPGARTVLLVARPDVSPDRFRTVVSRLVAEAPRTSTTGPTMVEVRAPASLETTVEIPVTYDGPDLADVAGLTGLAPEEVVAAHTGTPWRVAFGGFAPGFAYLVGGDPRLRVPRRESPRTRVPPGAVGLAGEFSGVYPRASPGGWRLVGRTDLPMWDVDRDPPALLTAGATVRFVAT